MKREGTANHNLAEDRARVKAMTDMVATLVRRGSESGRLISEDELYCQAIEQNGLPSSDGNPDFPSILAKALGQHEDLQALSAGDGSRWYYSLTVMTGSYALLLLQKQYDFTRLIVEVVRQNSAYYPRPVPVDTFTRSPFDLTGEQVSDCLGSIKAQEEYSDIAFTETSASTTFLYSTLYLEEDHATMLAEWFDVGQGENP